MDLMKNCENCKRLTVVKECWMLKKIENCERLTAEKDWKLWNKLWKIDSCNSLKVVKEHCEKNWNC